MSIEKINCSKEQLFEKIRSVCSELSIDINVKSDSDKHSEYSISRDIYKSILRVYVKKDGLKLDTSVGRDKELNLKIEEKLKVILNQTKHAIFTYKNIDEEKFDSIYQSLKELAIGDIILSNRTNNDPHKSCFFEIKNRITNECITIAKYKNGTLTVDGVVWILWEDVCQIIEMNNSNLTVNDIIDRLLVEDNETVDNNDFSKEEREVKRLITNDVYDFLAEHFKDYLISAQCILSNNVKMKEYSTVLCPVAKVLEGYLKSLLIELKLEKKISMNKNWRFSKIFTQDGIKSFNGGNITEEQEEELKSVYSLVKEFRHDINHGGPKPRLVIKDKEICKSKYEEILKKIIDSYYIIFP